MFAQREAAQEAVLERLIGSLEECRHGREFSPGHRSSCGRCELCRVSSELIDKWYAKLCNCEYAALECDMLSSKALKDRVLLKVTGADEGASEDRMKKTSVFDRTARSCAQNAVVTSVLFLADPVNRRLAVIIARTDQFVKKLQNRHVDECRTVEGCQKWLRDMVRGEYMHFVGQTLATMTEISIVREAGFVEDMAADKFYDEDAVILEDDLADTWGLFNLGLSTGALKRWLPILIGWPWSAVRVLDEGEPAAKCCEEFAAQYASFKARKTKTC